MGEAPVDQLLRLVLGQLRLPFVPLPHHLDLATARRPRRSRCAHERRVRIQPYLSRELQVRLRSWAAAEGVTESAAVEAALSEYLDGGRADKELIARRLDVDDSLYTFASERARLGRRELWPFILRSLFTISRHPDE